MAWIEVHQGIFFHRKTLLLATLTGRTPNDTVATLIRFWHWAMSHAETGETVHIPHEVLEHAACAEPGWIESINLAARCGFGNGARKSFAGRGATTGISIVADAGHPGPRSLGAHHRGS